MRYVERSPVAESVTGEVQAPSPHTGLASLVENAGCASHPRAWGRWVAGRGRVATGGAPSCACPQDSPPDRRSCPAGRGPPYPLAHSLRTSACQAPPAPSRWTVGVPHGIEAAGRNGSLRGGARTKRRTVGYTVFLHSCRWKTSCLPSRRPGTDRTCRDAKRMVESKRASGSDPCLSCAG